MKRFLLLLFLVFPSIILNAQITWDGEGDGNSWNDANNWVGDALPLNTDNVVLDNSIVPGNYIVTLPGGATNTTINTLAITPGAGNTIRLLLPAANTAAPALTVTQTSGDAILIGNGGILENSNTAASGTVIIIPVFADTRINNGGRYIHNCSLNSVDVVYSLSTAAGTELGVFEYAQGSPTPIPANAVTFGSIELTTTGTKTFSTTGSGDMVIRGYLKINAGVTLNSIHTGNFWIGGDLIINGNFDLSPTSAALMPALNFNGTSNQTITGSGNFTFGANFRNIQVLAVARVTLQRGITLSNVAHNFIVNNGGTLQMAENVIGGTGRFQLLSGAWLGIGSPGGIAGSGLSGNVQTSNRSFASGGTYEYNSGVGVTQVTGSGLPSTVSGKLKINSQAGPGTTGVTLSTTMMVSGEFILTEGKLTTGSNIIFIGSSAITTATYLDNSFVDGRMAKDGNTPYKFPIGSGTDIHPLQLETTVGTPADRYFVQYFKANPSVVCSPGTPTGGIDHVSQLEYWSVQCLQNGATPPVNQITLYATGYSRATERSSLVITNCSGSNWINLGNANTGLSGAFGDVTSLSSITGPFNFNFTLASIAPYPENPLPIKLISFDAIKLANTKSSINWELAAYCSAAAKFEIQRANTDRFFLKIAVINGNETNKLYNYIDSDLKNGINYYRLKMIDEDGKITYSRTAAVMNGVNGLLLTSLIPTIVTNTASLTFASSAAQKIGILIVDLQGRIMLKQHRSVAAGNSTIQLSMKGIGAGVYQLTGISAEGKTNTIRFIKQ
ncbi:MAG: T9SS type A sorting domain-containing protein [Bacteroidota bacterium]